MCLEIIGWSAKLWADFVGIELVHVRQGDELVLIWIKEERTWALLVYTPAIFGDSNEVL